MENEKEVNALHFQFSIPDLFMKVRVEGLEPPCLAASDPKSDTSTNFATPADKAEGLRLKVKGFIHLFTFRLLPFTLNGLQM